MSVTAPAQYNVGSQNQDPIFDDTPLPSRKLDKEKLKEKVREILREPCKVNIKQLVHKATYGRADPFEDFDPEAFGRRIQKIIELSPQPPKP